MIEKLAKFLHEECWMVIAKGLSKEENLSKKRIERWERECFLPYEKLSEKMKDVDRVFAHKLLPLIESHISDRYLNLYECVNRLIKDYEKHGNLFIAFDFDNTVFDYHNTGETFPKMEKLLRFLKKNKFKLILFTSNEGEKLNNIKLYCKQKGFEPDYCNENPLMETKKPYYNLLLDDRAGLSSAYEIIILTLNFLNYDYKH